MIEFTVPSMTCGHCVRTVTQVVQQLDPAAQVHIALEQKRLTVTSSSADRSALAAALTAAGYSPA